MNDTEIDPVHTDEEALTCEVSDEALESAADTENAPVGNVTMLCTGSFHTSC